MSNSYQPKRKELAKVSVISSETYRKNHKNLKLVGTVNRSFTNFVTTQRNRKTGQCTFIDDTSALTKKSKNDLARFFSNKKNHNKHVAYLVTKK